MRNSHFGSLVVACSLVVLLGSRCPSPTDSSEAATTCTNISGASVAKAQNAKSGTTAYAASCDAQGKPLSGGDPFDVQADAAGNVTVDTCKCPTQKCWTGKVCVAVYVPPAIACGSFTSKPSCTGAVPNNPAKLCVWAETADKSKSVCFDYPAFCADLNSNPAFTGDSNKVLATAAAVAVTAATPASGKIPYGCFINSGNFVGDCHPAAVGGPTPQNCESFKVDTRDNQCGADGSIASVLCDAPGTTHDPDGGTDCPAFASGGTLGQAAINKCDGGYKDQATCEGTTVQDIAGTCAWGA